MICGPAEDVWTTNDVGMLKGLVYSGVDLSAWKAHLKKNPFDIKPAFIAHAHDRAAAARRPSSGGRPNHPSFPNRWSYEPDRDRDPRRQAKPAAAPARSRLCRQAPARQPLHRQDLDRALEREDMREYLGGIGLGAKILYDEVGPKVHWDHPDNRLILATGPLAGLPVWGTGGLTVITRGALTDGATSTQANGFFGAALKYSGYDAIVIQGQAKKLSYLYINDDVVEIRDAAHLEGKDTWETQQALEAEHGLAGHRLSVYSHRARRGEPRPLRGHPRRLRPRGVQERLRRGHGQEEAQGGVHRARHQGAAPPTTRAGSSRPPTTSRTISRPIPSTSDALQLRHAARAS